MAIDYVEIRSKIDRETIGIIDGAKSIIWHTVYYGVGDFEIYAKATSTNIELLQEGNYVTRPIDYVNGKYKSIGIIEHIEKTNSIQDGYMIIASGRFAKSILDRRQIYRLSGYTNNVTVLSGNVETSIRSLVTNNAINCTFDNKRNISILELGTLANIPAIIVDENGNAAQKQVSYENLLEYSDKVLEEYNMSAYVSLNDDNKKLLYTVYTGENRSTDNTDNNEPVIFSTEFDNLTESEYVYDISAMKTTALIGGSGEDIDRFYTMLNNSPTGLNRRETWIDASSISKSVKISELKALYPNGAFSGFDFVVLGTTIATLEVNNEEMSKEYTLAELQEKFPSGYASNTTFTTSSGTLTINNTHFCGLMGVVLAYGFLTGAIMKYRLTKAGYLALLSVDNKDGQCTYANAIYQQILQTSGNNTLATLTQTETFNGTLNVTGGVWRLNEHYFLGDIVTIQDKTIGKYINARITEITEAQDENGYSVDVTYKS